MAFDDDKFDIGTNYVLWNAIDKINKEYSSYDFSVVKGDEIAHYTKNTSKAKYGHSYAGGLIISNCKFDFDAFLISKIFEEKHIYVPYIQKYLKIAEVYYTYYTKAREAFDKYRLYKSVRDCPKDKRGWLARTFGADEHERFRQLDSYEEERFQRYIINANFPYVKITLTASSQYDTYSRDKIMDFWTVIKCYAAAIEKEGKMTFIQKQRAIVSDDMRYEVLKRDRFRCRICGATAADGVKLEVDHIIPVSKGGKSTMDNLQCLCERCNRGKRDKL